MTASLPYLLILFGLLASLDLSAQSEKRQCLIGADFSEMPALDSFESIYDDLEEKDLNPAAERGKIYIPVVVHIVYQDETGNIDNGQVFSQITALNRDFNRNNENLDLIPEKFRNRIGNVGFNFCLAEIDPEGKPTIGITRTPTDPNNVFTGQVPWVFYSAQGGKSAWDTEQYVNVWVTRLGRNISGYGSRPGSTPPAEQGIVVAPAYFGMTGSAADPFALGRTVTHEMGHFFNLYHPWGRFSDCTDDDFVKDTPLQSEQYFGCPDSQSQSCGSQDITANFMNFSEDACLAMFTRGQAARMQATLIFARSGLLESTGCKSATVINPSTEILVYPNPANYFFCIATGNLPSDSVAFRMLDVKGAVVMEGSVVTGERQYLSVSKNGIYFLQFFSGDQTIVKKIVIARQ